MDILARSSRAKIRTMARPKAPDMPPKRTKKVRFSLIESMSKLHQLLLKIDQSLVSSLLSDDITWEKKPQKL